MSLGIGNKSALKTTCGVTHIPTQREASRTLRKVKGKFERLQAAQDKLLVTVATVQFYEGKIAELEQLHVGNRDWEFQDKLAPVYDQIRAQFEEKFANRKLPGVKRSTVKRGRNDDHSNRY